MYIVLVVYILQILLRCSYENYIKSIISFRFGSHFIVILHRGLKNLPKYSSIFYKSWKSLQMQKVVCLVFSYKPVQQSCLESWHIQYLFLIKRLLRGTTESSFSILDTMYIYWWISHTYPAVWFWLGKKKSFLYFLTG